MAWHLCECVTSCNQLSLSFVKQRLAIDLVVSLLVEADKVVVCVVKICSDLLTKIVVHVGGWQNLYAQKYGGETWETGPPDNCVFSQLGNYQLSER